MRNERLVLAIGNIADEYIIEASPVAIGLSKPVAIKPRRRVFIGLVAAVIALMMGLLTAMAVNEDFRNAVLTLFNLNMSAAEVVPDKDGNMMVVDIIDDADYDEMMKILYPDGIVDGQGHDIPGIENMEDVRAGFIIESFKAYSADGTELTEAEATPFYVTLENMSDGRFECLFFKVETGSDSLVYPSEMHSGFVSASEAGVYLAYTDISIWRIDPRKMDAEKISSDSYNGENLFELRDTQGAINFFWIDGVQLSPDGAYAVYRTTRDCAPGGGTSVWVIDTATGEEYQAIAPNTNNDIVGFLSDSHIMVGALADTRIANIKSGAITSVTFPELPNFCVSAASNGTVIYSSYPEGSSTTTAFVSRVDLETGRLTPVTEVVGYLDGEPRLSKSGKTAAIGYGTDPMVGVVDVMLVDLSSGEQTLLTALLAGEQQIDGLIRHFRWAADDTLVIDVQTGSNFQSYMLTLGD